MGRFDSTKAAIDANIKKNDNREITGSILNYVMNNMVDATESQLEATDSRITKVSEDLESKADKSEVSIPDWDAAEDEAGYIKNRTHYKEAVERSFVGIEKGDYILDAVGNPDGWESWVEAGGVEDENAKVILPVTISLGLGSLNFELTFDHVGQREILEYEEYEDSYASILEVGIDEKEGECYLHFTTRGCGIPWLNDGDEIDVRIESFKRLNDGYIPSTIVRKSDLEKVLAEMESQNEMIEDLQNTKIDKEADDYYPQLSVGLADNLAGVDVVDSEISFRRSGGGAISDGVARIEAIKGNSVVWNQLYSDDWTFTMYGITSTSINGLISIEGTAENTITQFQPFTANELNHKYLFVLSGASSQLEGKDFQLHNRSVYSVVRGGYAYLFHNNTDNSKLTYFGLSELSVGDVVLEHNIRVNQYDLTKMFGAGNEPTTIEEFYSRIPMGVDLNAYNEDEVIHMDVQSLESVGVNQWDEEWELGTIKGDDGTLVDDSMMIRTKNLIRVFPNKEYHFTQPSQLPIRVFLYGADKAYKAYEYITSASFLIPSDVHYIKVVFEYATYNHDICINLFDASINGKYYPYIKRVEDLAVIRKYFPQGMKSAGTAHDEIRYNKATQKWEKVQRIGSVDLGSLTWVYYDNRGYLRGWTNGIPRAKGGNTTLAVIANSICHKYPCIGRNELIYSGVDNSHALENDNEFSESLVMYVRDSSYTNAASFKAAMQGVVLYYELAQPIVTEIEGDFNLDYEVWNGGTEEVISDVPTTPLKADIAYGFNAVGKIKELEEKINSGGGGVSKDYVDGKLTELSAEVGKKQDTITDLETIRSGASKGATALQSVPDTYATKTDVSNAIQTAITNELNADF